MLKVLLGLSIVLALIIVAVAYVDWSPTEQSLRNPPELVSDQIGDATPPVPVADEAASTDATLPPDEETLIASLLRKRRETAIAAMVWHSERLGVVDYSNLHADQAMHLQQLMMHCRSIPEEYGDFIDWQLTNLPYDREQADEIYSICGEVPRDDQAMVAMIDGALEYEMPQARHAYIEMTLEDVQGVDHERAIRFADELIREGDVSALIYKVALHTTGTPQDQRERYAAAKAVTDLIEHANNLGGPVGGDEVQFLSSKAHQELLAMQKQLSIDFSHEAVVVADSHARELGDLVMGGEEL